jgi:hypothetical protein
VISTVSTAFADAILCLPSLSEWYVLRRGSRGRRGSSGPPKIEGGSDGIAGGWNQDAAGSCACLWVAFESRSRT